MHCIFIPELCLNLESTGRVRSRLALDSSVVAGYENPTAPEPDRPLHDRLESRQGYVHTCYCVPVHGFAPAKPSRIIYIFSNQIKSRLFVYTPPLN